MVSITTMHRIVLLLVVMGVQPGELRLNGAALLTAEQIRTIVGSNSEARGVIGEALELFFIIPNKAADTPRSVNVLAEQLPSDWLPQVQGVTFVRLNLKEAERQTREGCLRLLLIMVESSGTTIKVDMTHGNRCEEDTRLAFEFSRTYRGWERSSGLPPNKPLALAHCSCHE